MALQYDWEPWGVRFGFDGLLHDDFQPLTSRSVSHIIELGGTFLGASRCEEFASPRGLRDAQRNLNERGIDALVVIGGDGSMSGARDLQAAGIPTIGVPGTIENDVCGTDMAIGTDNRPEHRSGGARPHQGYRLVPSPGVSRRDDGRQVGLPGPHGGHRRRRRDGLHPRGALYPGRRDARGSRYLRARQEALHHHRGRGCPTPTPPRLPST